MNIFPFLHFFNLMVFMYLAVYIFLKNPKALVNRICVVVFLCVGTWSFSMIFIHNPATTKVTAWIFSGIGSLGWASVSSLFLWFILAFTGKKDILKKKWIYPVLCVFPLLFIYAQWTNHLFIDFSKEAFGWKPLYSRSLWPHLLYLYYLSFMTLGLYITFDFMKKTPNPVQKKQARIIFIAVLITLILGTFTDTVLPLLNIHYVPNMGDTALLLWAFAVVYGMVKYKFLTITPITAAGNIISTMFDCLILLDLHGNIVTVNEATLEVSGYRENELKGESADILLSGEKPGNHVIDEIVGEGNLKNKDFLFKAKDGKQIPVLFSSSVLRDETGAAGGIVCVAKDISERKRLEEELLKSKKLESIGILAGGIAHDFNNLLSVIIGNTLLARQSIPMEDRAYHLLVKAEDASIKAAELAGKFVTFSPGGWVRKREVTLTDVLKNIETTGLPGADTDVSYDIEIPGTLMPINGDPDQLNQVIKSLFFNAVEAMPAMPAENVKKGKIYVRAENAILDDPDDERILLKKGIYVKITIRDNGIGIPPEYIEKIFDPYFSTKDTADRKGTGLGLTTCYSIIKNHDGHITVESEVGKGTVATLYLPVLKKGLP